MLLYFNDVLFRSRNDGPLHAHDDGGGGRCPDGRGPEPGVLQLRGGPGLHQEEAESAPAAGQAHGVEEEGPGHLQGGAVPAVGQVVLDQGGSVLLQRRQG